MIGTGLAVLGALAGAGASIYASSKNSDAAAQAAALQQQQMATNNANVKPFIAGGQGASNLLQSFYGIGGDPALGTSALSRFQQSPDYQFALKGGSDALDNSAASKNGLMGGNQIRAQTEYGQGLATQNLGNYLTRLSGMAGQGISAAGAIAQPNTIGAATAGNSIMAQGTADASGVLGAYNNLKGGLSNMSLMDQMSKSSYGGSGGSTPFNLTGTGQLY